MVLVFIPREGEAGETRVAATPDTVKGLIKAGATVAIESGAGDSAGFPDADFREAGADVGAAKWGEADLVLGIRPPAAEQISSMKQGANLICGMQPHLALDQVKACRDNKVTLFSMDVIPRISRAQSMDVLSSQATVAGYMAVLLGAIEMPNFMPQFMTAAGTIRPAKVLVLGAGVAGLQAIATARRLGAHGRGQRRPSRDAKTRSRASAPSSSTPGQAARGAGHRRLRQGDHARSRCSKQKEDPRRSTSRAGGPAHHDRELIPGRPAPKLVDRFDAREGHARRARVIVDLAAPMGGNVEGTKPGETADDVGVTILGELNLPAHAAPPTRAGCGRAQHSPTLAQACSLARAARSLPDLGGRDPRRVAASPATARSQHEGAPSDALAGGRPVMEAHPVRRRPVRASSPRPSSASSSSPRSQPTLHTPLMSGSATRSRASRSSARSHRCTPTTRWHDGSRTLDRPACADLRDDQRRRRLPGHGPDARHVRSQEEEELS
jgi:NAD(P) transhydrogenase subunit alpha